MDCLHPVSIRNRGQGPAFIQVPCGKCPNCLATKLNKWVFRLKHHFKSFKYAYFCTLTYDNEHLPYSYVDKDRIVHVMFEQYPAEFLGDDAYVPCLYKPHLQKFFRKIRKFYNLHFNETNILSYYAIGEYGMNPRDGVNDRPHYHFILFTNLADFSSIEKCYDTISYFWDKGFIDVKEVTDYRIQYVCKHHLKPKNSKYFDVPQFTLRSNGIGLGFLQPDVVDWFRQNKPTVIHQTDGIKIGIPRYIRNKLLELYNVDLSCEYKQRKTPMQKIVDDSRFSNKLVSHVIKLRARNEFLKEENNLYKSKNKRK